MYGMINEAIRLMVIERHGEATWEEMRERAGADDVFLRMGQYPDEQTYRLVAVATDMLGVEAEQVLRSFGDYWIDFAYDNYGELLAVSGNSFIELVENLNDLHSRVGHMLPDLRPPSFLLTDRSETSFRLHYYSTRQGLEPMVIGLVEGLGRRFNTQVEIEHLPQQTPDQDHEQFQVSYRPLEPNTAH